MGASTEQASTAVIHAAVDAGITFFDTADAYGGRGASETIIGNALAGGRRDRVVIATKFAAPFDGEPAGKGAGADWIKLAVDGSLRRLQTDRIDLYQQHVFDATVPIEETQGALAELVAAGKVLRGRLQQLLGSPARRRRDAERRALLAPLRQRPEPLQPARPRAARRGHPGVRATGHGVPAVLPARVRHADRQVPRRRGVPGRHPAGRHAGRAGGQLRQRSQPPPRRRARRASRPSAATPSSSWRSPGWRRSRRSRRSSPARRHRRRSPPTRQRWTGR